MTRLLATGGEGFRIRETPHFIVAYDTPNDTVQPLTGRLEATFAAVWRFCEVNMPPIAPPTSRLQVLLFDRGEKYREYRVGLGLPADGITPGFYWPETNVAAFANIQSRPEVARITVEIERTLAELVESQTKGASGESTGTNRRALRHRADTLLKNRDAIVERFNRLVIQHEAAHLVLYNLGLHVRGAENPRWFVEGLACLFEILRGDPGESFKHVNQMRLADLRDALGVGPAAKSCSDAQYRAALDSRRLVSLSEFISQPEAFTHPGTNTANRYAQAWGMVYYLHCEHSDEFSTYMRMLSSRSPAKPVDRAREIGDFVAVFGPIDRDFERKWIGYMLKLRYEPGEAGRETISE